MSLKTVIQSLDFFTTLDDRQLDQLCSIASIHSYEKEYILHYEQDESHKLCFLLSGLAKAYKIDKHDNEIFLYYLYKNTLISDITNIKDAPIQNFSNIAFLDYSEVLEIDYKKFRSLFLESNILGITFINAALARTQQLQDLINREFIFDSVSKVAMMIDTDLEIFNQLKRHEISLILNIQPATLSRVLKRLKRDNIISIEHGRISVANVPHLKKIYKDGLDD